MNINYLLAKNGQNTIKINEYFLHSQYNPEREAEEIIKHKYKKEYVHIFFGYGAGHLINAFKKVEGKDSNYIVIEPILEKVELENNIFYLNEDNGYKLVQFLINNIKVDDRVNIILSPNYDKLVSTKYVEFLKAVKEVQRILIMSENTVNFFDGIWDKNYLFNSVNSIKDNSLSVLEKKYNCPIVIASAGPSLTKQLPLLKQVRDKIILISAGSAINSLLNVGIEPDYAISIDGSDENYNHYKDLKGLSCNFIYDVYSHPSIRSIFKNGYYFVAGLNQEIASHFRNLVNKETPLILGGVSVATYCLSIATYITSGPIALIGQDLAYTNNQTHASGNKRLELVDEKFKEKTKLIEAKGYYDDIVYTGYDLLAMKRVFEQLITVNNYENKIYNCTEGGIKLEGYNQIAFKVFCDDFTNEIKTIFDHQTPVDYEEDYKSLKIKLEKELEICKEIKNLCQKAMKVLNRNNLKDAFSRDILKKLDKLDDKILSNINKTALSITYAAINLKINKYYKAKPNETKQQEYERIFKKSETLYMKMDEATDSYLNIINEVTQ